MVLVNSLLLCTFLISGFSSAFRIPSARSTANSSVSNSTTRNIIYVDGPTQGSNSSSGGTPTNITTLISEKTHITHVILSSAHLNSAGQGANESTPYVNFWNDQPLDSSEQDFIWPQVKILQKHGVKVLLSLGGADDGSWGHLLTNFSSFYPPLMKALKDHKFDGVDLDIETSYTTAGALKLMKKLVADLGDDFLITQAPVQECLAEAGECSFGSIDYQQLDNNGSYPNRPNGKLISWYNTQFYAGGGDGANSPTTYENVVKNFAPQRVVLGVSDCSIDGSGWYNLTTYNSTVTKLRQKYGADFGGVFGWDWANAGSCEGLEQPWQWVKAMGEILFRSLS